MATLPDRRRINGPQAGTREPIYTSSPTPRPSRTRSPNEVRKIFLKTGLTPSASGSAYLELALSSPPSSSKSTHTSGLKLICNVHGPGPLPRSAPFAPHLLLNTRIKFATFANARRRGYIPDLTERDLATHLETALQGVLIHERWPKSGVDISITILEGEEEEEGSRHGCRDSLMTVLAGCITVTSAAIIDAGIDCLDVITGGVAALVRQPDGDSIMVLDPCAREHGDDNDGDEIEMCGVVAYMALRDQVTEVWARGGPLSRGGQYESLIDHAVEAASAVRMVLVESSMHATETKVGLLGR